jgi:branched-chain amino acid aminotransferase
VVTNGQLVTSSLEDNVLPGITRDTIIQLAQRELGMEVVQRTIDRSELYLADEVFLTGTAAHLTPVIELDNRPIADRNPGPVSTKLQKMYFDIVVGRNPKYLHWCTTAQPRLVTV